MKKFLIAFLLCCFIGGTAYAVDYKTISDTYSGTIEYFDLDGDTTRTYVTQNAWFSDAKSFIVRKESDQKIYRYNILTHKAEALFKDGLVLDNAAVVGPDDTVYAACHADGNLYAQKIKDQTEQVEEVEPLTMTLPFKENYTTDENHTDSEGEWYTENGLSFRLNNVNRYRDVVTVAKQRGGKWCRTTVSERRSGSGNLWFEYYSYNYTMKSSHMSYQVDNSRISADTRNITIEFDYYDDSNSELSGKAIELQYLKYNNGGTPTKATKSVVTFTGSNTWKTAKAVLTDAQFDKSSAVASDGVNYDFRLGVGVNRGGFASTWIKVYPTPADNTKEVSCEVNAAGTGYSGALEPSIWSGSYDRNIGYSGTEGMSAVNEKHYLFNKEFTGYLSGQEYKRWRNAFYFKVPDTFLYGNNYDAVEIEVEYYAPTATEIAIVAKNSSGVDKTLGKTSATTGAWTTKTFTIASDDANGIVFSNGFESSADFRFNFMDAQGYVHKVTVRKTDIRNLGDKKGGWHPHVSKNGDLSLTDGNTTLIIYEANNQRFATTDGWVKSAHCIINPVYPNLVLYSYEGDKAETTNGRIRLFNRSTMFKGVIFEQHKNSANDGTTGEAIGHENWSPDGEHIVAVKYREDTNVGKNGIVRMDKYGGNREYINDDYDYWHCDASPDGRWIVADTELVDRFNTKKEVNGEEKTKVVGTTTIVLIDTKTGKSYPVAEQKAFLDDPCQPHASFSTDGNKVTFGIAYDYTEKTVNIWGDKERTYTYGVAIVDVSSIVNDDQLGEPADPTDFTISPFTIGFNKDTGKNEVTASVDNIDGQTRAMNLFAAVYDADGKLISVGKKRYNSANDATLTADFDGVAEGQTLKCFVWNDGDKPIENNVETIKWLRAAKVSNTEVVLSWQNESDMPVLKYEVFRGNSKIGETPYTVYRDRNLTQNTKYTYYVRPVYSAFGLGEDGAAISANIGDLNFDGIYSVLGDPIKNYGLTFLENNNLATDSYTELKTIGGENCRKARRVEQGETDSQGNKRWGSAYNGNFYFKCDRNVVTASTNKVLIGVRYYDNRSGVNLGIDYQNESGTTTNRTVVTKTGTDTWKTATITLEDAKFVGNSDWYGYDFRFQGGYDMYISRVWVIPLDENGNVRTNDGLGGQIVGDKAGVKVTTATNSSTNLYSVNKQYVEWNPSTSTGLTTEKTGDTSVWINGNMNDWFKFNVENGYMYGAKNNMAWIEITYYDEGTSKIYVYYNTSDPTASTAGEKAGKPADTVITCTDTGEWKTATIPIIDAEFSDEREATYDFVIRVDSTVNAGSTVNGVSFKRVRVVGY